ncbi:hypothetical protein GQ457_17G007680 [Hibiscus cannabinus]
MLWWRRRRHDIEKGTCTISTFDDFKRELKRQFYPENAEDEARARLRRLKQSGNIRDYIKEFTNLVLEIPDLSDKDSLFNFMDGLQPWAKTELKRRGVQDLADAIAKAESLIDYTSRKESTPKPRDWKSVQAKGGGERSQRQESHQDDSPLRHKESSPWKGKAKATDSRNLRKPSYNKCFICDGDHWVRECPQRQALSSLLARHQESNNDDSCQEGAHIGSLQQLNGIQSTPKTEATGLLYADVTINGKATRAMLDTGASHNFVSIDEADRLGLKATGAKGAVKAINSAARPIHGVAQEVKTIVGTWSGRMNYTIVPMDDFKVILGLEFFNQAKAIPMPFANTMSITEGKQACVVPTYRATKQKVKVLSALQLEEFEKVTKEKANNQGSFKITKGPQLTTSPSRATSYERERLAQHKGANHCRKRADKKRRPSRFKKGSAHCRSKKGVRESPVVNQGPTPTIPRQPRDEGIAGLAPNFTVDEGATRVNAEVHLKHILGVVKSDLLPSVGVGCQKPSPGSKTLCKHEEPFRVLEDHRVSNVETMGPKPLIGDQGDPKTSKPHLVRESSYEDVPRKTRQHGGNGEGKQSLWGDEPIRIRRFLWGKPSLWGDICARSEPRDHGESKFMRVGR